MANYNIHNLLTVGSQNYCGHEYIFERNGNVFEGKCYDQFANDVHCFASYLISNGLSGRNIMLFGANSYNYMVADTAVMGYVGASCTISKEWSAHDVINAVKLLNTGAIIYSRQKQDVINSVRAEFPLLLYIVLEDILQTKSENISAPAPIDSSACCKIIFSSGTTGIPKAVMLSQKNMFANWESLYKRAPFTSQDKDYLFLPLSHTYGGICNFLYSLITGMQIYICSDTKLIMEELQMVKPTVLCAVPLIYEKIYAASAANAISPTAALGGSIRYLFSGGAYLKSEIRQFFKNANINLLEAYGLTETSSLISCEYSDLSDFNSVGTVMENMEIRIDNPDDNNVGEIMVRGDNVFMGYYNNPDANKNAFDCDGFFRTGDLGFLKEGKLYLAGRKRRMILLSNGENVYPDEIESLFSQYSDINRVKVYVRDSAIFASVYVASNCNVETIIAEVNNKLPKFSHIKDFEIINDSIETRLK